MSIVTITESQAEFSFDGDRLWLLENEPFYAKLQGVKVCDFVYLADSDSRLSEQLLIIEVKTNAPKDRKYFVQDICAKFVDSILMYVGGYAARPKTQPTTLPPLLSGKNALGREIRLILIVTSPNFKREWLAPLSASLRKECRPLVNLFSLEETQVYNIALAKKYLGIQIKFVP